MSKTCMQQVIGRDHRLVWRRRPHAVPNGTGNPNNGYARCRECGAEVYVGTGLHQNLNVPLRDAEAEARFLRQHS